MGFSEIGYIFGDNGAWHPPGQGTTVPSPNGSSGREYCYECHERRDCDYYWTAKYFFARCTKCGTLFYMTER